MWPLQPPLPTPRTTEQQLWGERSDVLKDGAGWCFPTCPVSFRRVGIYLYPEGEAWGISRLGCGQGYPWLEVLFSLGRTTTQDFGEPRWGLEKGKKHCPTQK